MLQDLATTSMGSSMAVEHVAEPGNNKYGLINGSRTCCRTWQQQLWAHQRQSNMLQDLATTTMGSSTAVEHVAGPGNNKYGLINGSRTCCRTWQQQVWAHQRQSNMLQDLATTSIGSSTAVEHVAEPGNNKYGLINGSRTCCRTWQQQVWAHQRQSNMLQDLATTSMGSSTAVEHVAEPGNNKHGLINGSRTCCRTWQQQVWAHQRITQRQGTR